MTGRKEKRALFEPGPLLSDLLGAQLRNEALLGDFERLRGLASQVARRCDELRGPLVWPVGPAAERLAGAAVLVGAGRVTVRGWSGGLSGARVLVLAMAEVTPFAVVEAARHARALGAAEVHAAAVDLGIGTDHAVFEHVARYRALDEPAYPELAPLSA